MENSAALIGLFLLRLFGMPQLTESCTQGKISRLVATTGIGKVWSTDGSVLGDKCDKGGQYVATFFRNTALYAHSKTPVFIVSNAAPNNGMTLHTAYSSGSGASVSTQNLILILLNGELQDFDPSDKEGIRHCIRPRPSFSQTFDWVGYGGRRICYIYNNRQNTDACQAGFLYQLAANRMQYEEKESLQKSIVEWKPTYRASEWYNFNGELLCKFVCTNTGLPGKPVDCKDAAGKPIDCNSVDCIGSACTDTDGIPKDCKDSKGKSVDCHSQDCLGKDCKNQNPAITNTNTTRQDCKNPTGNPIDCKSNDCTGKDCTKPDGQPKDCKNAKQQPVDCHDKECLGKDCNKSENKPRDVKCRGGTPLVAKTTDPKDAYEEVGEQGTTFHFNYAVSGDGCESGAFVAGYLQNIAVYAHSKSTIAMVIEKKPEASDQKGKIGIFNVYRTETTVLPSYWIIVIFNGRLNSFDPNFKWWCGYHVPMVAYFGIWWKFPPTISTRLGIGREYAEKCIRHDYEANWNKSQVKDWRTETLPIAVNNGNPDACRFSCKNTGLPSRECKDKNGKYLDCNDKNCIGKDCKKPDCKDSNGNQVDCKEKNCIGKDCDPGSASTKDCKLKNGKPADCTDPACIGKDCVIDGNNKKDCKDSAGNQVDCKDPGCIGKDCESGSGNTKDCKDASGKPIDCKDKNCIGKDCQHDGGNGKDCKDKNGLPIDCKSNFCLFGKDCLTSTGTPKDCKDSSGNQVDCSDTRCNGKDCHIIDSPKFDEYGEQGGLIILPDPFEPESGFNNEVGEHSKQNYFKRLIFYDYDPTEPISDSSANSDNCSNLVNNGVVPISDHNITITINVNQDGGVNNYTMTTDGATGSHGNPPTVTIT